MSRPKLPDFGADVKFDTPFAPRTFDLRELVKNAFENAAENGQTFEGWDDDRIATDMLDCDADIEGHDFNEVLALVKELRP